MTVELKVETFFDYIEGPDVLTCTEQPCSGEQLLSPSSSPSEPGDVRVDRRPWLLLSSSDDEETPGLSCSSELERKGKMGTRKVSGTDNCWLYYTCITCRPLQLHVSNYKNCLCTGAMCRVHLKGKKS